MFWHIIYYTIVLLLEDINVYNNYFILENVLCPPTFTFTLVGSLEYNFKRVI